MLVAFAVTATTSCLLFVDVPENGATPPLDDASSDRAAEAAPIGTDADANRPDTSTPPPCNLASPFGALRQLQELNLSSHEYRATLSPDELIIVYTRAGWAIYEARRAKRTDVFTQLTPIVDTTVGTAALSADGLTVYYAKSLDGGAEDRLFRATRTNLAGAFPAGGFPVKGAAVAGSVSDNEPYVVDGRLLFTSRGAGDTDLYEGTLDTIGNLAEVHPIPGSGVNLSPGSERSPVMTADRKRLYFSSDRPFGKGTYDIYVAERASTAMDFGQPVNVEELNSPGGDAPGWISPDGCRIYFATDRVDGGSGGSDIWVAEKPAL